MNYLLDTHIFLWAIFEPEKIPKKLRSIMLDVELAKFISLVTFWEISLKFTLGKIDLKGIFPDSLPTTAKNDGFKMLELNIDTASSFHKLLKTNNKDPFDRMLAWQAICSDFILLTSDREFSDFKGQGLKTLW